MLCIRIEAQDGIGMFNSLGYTRKTVSTFCQGLSYRHQNFNTPFEDDLDLNLNDQEWFCAYKSIEQVQNWIMPEEFEILFENGFKVYLQEVDQFQEGNDQIIFTKESITLKKDISDLFVQSL